MTMAVTARRGIDTTLNEREIVNGEPVLGGGSAPVGGIVLFNESRVTSLPLVTNSNVGRDDSGKVVCIRPVAGDALLFGKYAVIVNKAIASEGKGSAVVTGDQVMITIIFDGNESGGAPVSPAAALYTGVVVPGAITGQKIIATLNDPWTGGAATGTVACTLRGDVGFGNIPNA